jgi:hypothetical protein
LLLVQLLRIVFSVQLILSFDHRLEMLCFVISNVQKYVIEISNNWSSSTWFSAGLEIIKHEGLFLVVFDCNFWSW